MVHWLGLTPQAEANPCNTFTSRRWAGPPPISSLVTTPLVETAPVCYDRNMAVLVLDSSALITAARFDVEGTSVLDHILTHCRLLIPETVKTEVVDAGLQGRYADAALLAERVRSGAIQVITTRPEAGAFERVLDDYAIETGDEDLLWLCRQAPSYEFAVVDDRLLYIILNRFQMRPRFLLDVIVWLVQQGAWSTDLAYQALDAVRPRYRSGFITHSVEQLKGNV